MVGVFIFIIAFFVNETVVENCTLWWWSAEKAIHFDERCGLIWHFHNLCALANVQGGGGKM